MKEYQNRNPLRSQAEETAIAPEKSTCSGGRRKFIRDFLFLFVLVCLLGVVVWHYSRFSVGGKFHQKTEDSGVISGTQGEIEYQRLLVRNRYPFELTVTVHLLRMDMNDDTASPRVFILDKRQYSFTGTRSLYSGTFETRVTIVTSGDGRFHVTDRSGKPDELLNMLKNLKTDRSIEEVDAELRASLVNKMREGQLTGIGTIQEDQRAYSKAITKYCSLSCEHPDKILMITMTPRRITGDNKTPSQSQYSAF